MSGGYSVPMRPDYPAALDLACIRQRAGELRVQAR